MDATETRVCLTVLHLSVENLVFSMIHTAVFVYTSLLVVMVINPCKYELNALIVLPCGRQCDTETFIWYLDHLQSPTAYFNSTNSLSKLSISPLIRYVADPVSFLCFLLYILLQFRAILYQKGEQTELGNLQTECCTFPSLFSRLSLRTCFTNIPSSIVFLTVLSVVLSMLHRFKSLYLTWRMITEW